MKDIAPASSVATSQNQPKAEAESAPTEVYSAAPAEGTKFSEDELKMKRDGFSRWDAVKQHLDIHGRTQRVRSGEIYWAGVGENIGSEINGKGNEFARPVVVIRKINHHTFIGVPLTTQPHDRPGFVHFEFRGRTEYAALLQVRSFSTKRLYRRMGRLDESVVVQLRHHLRQYIC